MELSEDDRTRLIYENREKARRDYQARLNGAFNDGIITVTKKMLQKQMSIDEIMDITGLTKAEIEQLSKEI